MGLELEKGLKHKKMKQTITHSCPMFSALLFYYDIQITFVTL
jgi:hypothetical protein